MTKEQMISHYLRTAYTDGNLAALFAHCQDGKLSYYSCCCLIGIPTADHALRPMMQTWDNWAARQPHWQRAMAVVGAEEVQAAFRLLADDPLLSREECDAQRRAKLIPLIEAEIERRSRDRSISSPEYVQEVGVSV